mmetsp:Transcript_14320/g.21845  ORF Transcript_14320/g.21845 Transcript_14320/m.21845 type:complete len:178 (+) Transcript_14320:410-943(+)
MISHNAPESMPTPDANTDDSQRLVVVFDEARVLATEGPIKLPNRCVKGELTNSNVVGVFLYTFGAMNLCMPEDSSSDQTESGIGKFNPLVFEIDTFDEFGDDHIQGTPLWKMNWQFRHNQDYMELVQFASHKLNPPNLDASQDEGLIAVLLCRFGLTRPHGALAKSLSQVTWLRWLE